MHRSDIIPCWPKKIGKNWHTEENAGDGEGRDRWRKNKHLLPSVQLEDLHATYTIANSFLPHCAGAWLDLYHHVDKRQSNDTSPDL